MSSQNLENLSIQELKKLVKKENEEVKKLEEENEKKRLIFALKKLQNKKEKLIQEKKNIKKTKFKTKSKSKTKSKPKSKTKSKPKSKTKSKPKSFQHYYQECIEGKDIPKDAPEYLKKALLKAKKEYEKGIILEKSALANFAEKFNIKGIPKLLPNEFFKEKAPQVKDFLRKYRNTKVRMILVCLMKNQVTINKLTTVQRDKAYFQSKTYINLENTVVKFILEDIKEDILGGLHNYEMYGSGWYFKEVIRLEIHIIDYKPMKGGSYISLPDFIKKKNAIINIENKDDNCFLWCVLRYFHPVQNHGERISDLKKYENDKFQTN